MKDQQLMFVAYLNSQLPQLWRLAKLFHSQGAAVILIYMRLEEIQPSWLERWQSIGAIMLDVNGKTYSPQPIPQPVPPAPSPQQLPGYKARLKKVPLAVNLYGWWNQARQVPFYFQQVRRELRQAKYLLDQVAPQALIFPEENTLVNTAAFTRSAGQRRIPTVVFPYTLANQTEFAESMYATSFLQIRGFNLLIALFFPRWVITYRQRRLLLMPWSRILATTWYRLTPPNPWMLNHGFATMIAVESDFFRDYLVDGGIPRTAIVVTGSPETDALAEGQQHRLERLSALQRELQLNPHKSILLCALPPPWFPRAEAEFSSFSELISAWMKVLASQQKFSVVVQLHPRLLYDDYAYIEQFGVKLTRRDVTELIPLADLFVASISATIRWAIACGLPVINYDVYQWKFTDYDRTPGVIKVNSLPDFTTQIQRLATDQNYLSALQAQQRTIAPAWGRLDGQAKQRILDLLDNVLTSHG